MPSEKNLSNTIMNIAAKCSQSTEIDAVKRQKAETAVELDALLPAILDMAFKGEL